MITDSIKEEQLASTHGLVGHGPYRRIVNQGFGDFSKLSERY
jgi:hypothetical protein